ncbi:SIR2 family protein [Acidisphaera sp. S103]|uniref:SIR2 family protein n=1 Tax=Acidisphaera sp. S103 TaxID=1747223 RepID=UPI00131C9A9C|nr:SIR2 family protein [Acidisphaera sp. S103]
MSSSAITFKKDEVLVLLGAGASVDAGIPHSADMVSQIEAALENEWAEFKHLYNYVRSAIFYAEGIAGRYAKDVNYNIERLVQSLDELARREDHPLYPFVGAWNPRLLQVAGPSFENIQPFRTKVLEKLRRDWLEIRNYESARYFEGLFRFQKDLNFPLRVFTLNYDMCVERTYDAFYRELPERGFDKVTRLWSHELLEESAPDEKNFYLYKLHGSVDWVKADDEKLTFSDSTANIKVDDGQIIFGVIYKLQYVDPFLFLMYQLRRQSLAARLLLVIGYGFADEHVNAILSQALRRSPGKRLLAVTWSSGQETEEVKRLSFESVIKKQLNLTDEDGKIVVRIARAKTFLGEQLSLSAVADLFPEEEQLFEDVTPPNAA